MDRKNKSATKKELYLEHISQPLVIAETHVQILNSAFVLLWRQNLNRIFDWVFENLVRLFWNKYLVELFGHRKTLRVFENLLCKKHTYTPTYIWWKPRFLSRALYLFFLLWNLSLNTILFFLHVVCFFFRY